MDQHGSAGEAGNGGKAAGGIGAALLALCAGVGQLGDDIGRVFSGGGRTVIINSSDDIGRGLSGGGRALSGSSDDIARGLMQPNHLPPGQPRLIPVTGEGSGSVILHPERLGASVNPSAIAKPKESTVGKVVVDIGQNVAQPVVENLGGSSDEDEPRRTLKPKR
jgi:hypothetical protein